MSKNAQELFQSLRPLCVEISKTSNANSIDTLLKIIQRLPNNSVQELHEYVLFPLRIVLLQRPSVKEETAIVAITCMGKVFEKLATIDWKLFNDVFKLLLGKVSLMTEGDVKYKGSEELKLSVLISLIFLNKLAVLNHAIEYFHIRNIPNLGYLVSTCLHLISTERNRKLKVQAISLLRTICLQNDEIDEIAMTMQGNCIASFLPGILSGLTSVICDDSKLGHAVSCSSINLVSVLLRVCLSENSLKVANTEKVKTEIQHLNKNVDGKILSLAVTRDKKWLEIATPKIDLVIQKLITLAGDSNISIRSELLKFSHSTLINCIDTLKISVGHLLKIPIIYLNDEIESMSSKSKRTIDKIAELLSDHHQNIQDVIFDSLFELCKNLPKNLRKFSDAEKLSSLNLVLGYLKVLSANLNILFNSPEHLNQLLNALFLCFKLDTSDLQKIEDVSLLPDNFDAENFSEFVGQLPYWQFHKNFLQFNNPNITKTLVKICRLLGEFGDLEVITDLLVENYTTESNGQQSVFILSEVILGTSETNANKVIDNLLEIFLADENWYLATSYESEYLTTHHRNKVKQNALSLYPLHKQNPVINTKMLNANLILVCLHLEALSAFSTTLKEKFCDKLIVALYPVLEKVNDSNHLISSCALSTLRKFATNCDYENVAELLTKNADYLVSKISVQMRHISLYPRSPIVLQVTLTHGDVSIFPLVRDTIDEVLTFLDLHRDTKLKSFLPVLLTTVKSINKWFKNEENNFKNDTKKQKNHIFQDKKAHNVNTVTQLVDELLEYQTNLRSANIDYDVDDSEMDEENDKKENFEDELTEHDMMSAQEQPKVTPPEVKIIVQIVERCCHLMSNFNPKIRLTVMEIVCEGINGLTSHEDSLLPLVHKLWSPLMERFNDPELQVVSMAFNVVCTMASSCGDFIRRRFTKELFCKLTFFLQIKSDNTNHQIATKQSQIFKLKHNLLKNLGPVLTSAKIKIVEHQSACESAYSYLGSKQPVPLQEGAVILFKHLIHLDPDLTWLFLSDVYTTTPEIIPNFKTFRTITLAGSQNSEFAKNVGFLLTLC